MMINFKYYIIHVMSVNLLYLTYKILLRIQQCDYYIILSWIITIKTYLDTK